MDIYTSIGSHIIMGSVRNVTGQRRSAWSCPTRLDSCFTAMDASPKGWAHSMRISDRSERYAEVKARSQSAYYGVNLQGRTDCEARAIYHGMLRKVPHRYLDRLLIWVTLSDA